MTEATAEPPAVWSWLLASAVALVQVDMIWLGVLVVGELG